MQENFRTKARRFFKNAFTTDDLFWESEIGANLQLAYSMIGGTVVLLLVWLLNEIGVFKSGDIRSLVIQGFFELLIPAVLCIALHGKKRWLKYVMMVEYIIVLARVDCSLSFNAVLLMAIPIVMSCWYYSYHFSAQVALLTTILFALSAYAGSAWNLGRLDLNFYTPAPGTVLTIETSIEDALAEVGIDLAERTQEYMFLYFFPKWMVYVIISIGCVFLAKRGHDLVVERAAVAEKTARIESELTLATDIQANMLPRIFPAFPDHKEFDVYATMNPAKEVGGDFYDFFMIDDTHVATIIADVSGKGIPAALFMVTAKTLVKDHAQLGLQPAEVFTRVNTILCEGNGAGLFVTGWMGVLDLQSGKLTYANAGHNPPLLCKNGRYSYLKSKAGFVLAGMESVRYRQAELQMEPGDKLFLYTDGVTEATDEALELYGEERLLRYLNEHSEISASELLPAVRRDLDLFVGKADQFDDITMLILDYKEKAGTGIAEKILPATDEHLPEAMRFVQEELEKADIPPKALMQISVAVEEIFVNVAHYAYPGRMENVKLELSVEDKSMRLCFKDRGIPFNPLTKENPDITLSAEERGIGGLGIFMVKKTMDDVAYQYKDGMNVLTLLKKWN